MALETGTYISDLVVTNPTSSDPKSQGDDHLRLLKSTIKTTFPGVTGAVTPTHTELNYVDGVTSAIQTQLDAKAPLASPALTGTPTTPTATVGTTGTQIASLDFVIATSLAGTLPGQTGNASKFLGTDGANASWSATIDTTVMLPAVGTKLATTTATESLSNKSLTTPVIQDSSDTTKKANFVLSSVTAGQNRNITIADENMTLFTPYAKLLGTVSASASATVDLEGYFVSTYDDYLITITGLVTPIGAGGNLWLRYKKAGAYIATGYRYLNAGATTLTTGAAQIVVLGGIQQVTSNEQVYVEVRITKPLDSIQHLTMMRGTTSNLSLGASYGGGHSTTGALEGVRFMLSSGNMTSGDFRIYGIRKT